MNVSRKLLYIFLISIFLPKNQKLYSHLTTPIGEPIEIMTQDSLHEALTLPNKAVIILKMDACPHCKTLMPIIEQAAQNHLYKNIDFYTANGPKLKASSAIQNITNGKIIIPGFPSIIFIHKGKIIDYQIGGNKKLLTEKLQKHAALK